MLLLATMASRFAEVNENGIIDLMFSSEHKNTRKSTNYGIKVLQEWAAERKVEQRLKSTSIELSTKLCHNFTLKFAVTMATTTSQKVMQAALERHLKGKNYPKSTLKDVEFQNLRKALEGKARKLQQQ